MPPVARVYGQYADKLTGRAVIRLHGPDREAMDERSGKDWSRIVDPRDGEVNALAVVVRDLQKRGKKAWVFANNHYEGCAPPDHRTDPGEDVAIFRKRDARQGALRRVAQCRCAFRCVPAILNMAF